jgi:GTPase SAR1 family protein
LLGLNANEIIFSIICRSEILGEVQTQGSAKLPSNKSVLVLGDNSSGKTSLIAKLQGVEDPKKGSGLEYAYIDVRDEYRDGEIIINLLINPT